MHYPKIG